MALTTSPARPDADRPATVDRARSMPAPRRAGGAVSALCALAVAIVVSGAAGFPPVGAGYVGLDALLVAAGFAVTRALNAACAERGPAQAAAAFYAAGARRVVPAVEVAVVATLVTWGLIVGVDRIGP